MPHSSVGRRSPRFLLPAVALALLSSSSCGTAQEPTLTESVVTSVTAAASESTPSTFRVVKPPSTTTTTTAPEVDLPPLVVYDTDMGPDVDDVLALAMLHIYADQGLAEIGAVTISRDSEPGARYADAVNTFYGRPDIRIGVDRDSYVEFDDAVNYTASAGTWPQDLDAASVPDAVPLLRRLLVEAEAAGREVIIVQTGFSGNLAGLLKSEGDDIDPRGGEQLVADTVDLLSVMAGATEYDMVEFNVEKDIGAARYLFWKWPVKLVLSPFELGYAILYPYSSITSDFSWADRHPVREAYEFADLHWHQDAPPYYDMRSWDLTSVMIALEPDSGLFSMSEPGLVTVTEDGKTSFTPGAEQGERQDVVLDNGPRYSEGDRQQVVDRMIELVSAQPAQE